jgi:predicted ATPase
MITSIRLQNFKGHRDTTVPLGRLTVLVGPNGSGKTSVLEALELQSRLATEAPADVFSGDASWIDLLGRGGEKDMSLLSEGTGPEGPWQLKTAISASPASEQASISCAWKQGDDAHVSQSWAGSSHGNVPQIRQVMGVVTLYKLSARRIAAAAHRDSVAPVVGYDGANTAVALETIKLGQDEDFARIEHEIRAIIPNIVRVRIKPMAVRIPMPKDVLPGHEQDAIGSKIFFDFRGAPNVPAHMASEGTLITLAILTVLLGPNRPNVLLLDDFDQSLHPQAQIEMVRLLKRLLEEFPDVQIVATTHSPYILDELDPQDVVVFALRADGSVATKRLSEHPQAAKMKDALSAGQLWSLDPEADWVPDEAVAAQ